MPSIEEPAQFKAQVRKSFDATPLTYGAEGDYHWDFAKRLIEHAPLHGSQTVLDVATGTAPAALMAARIVGPYGRVIGIDISPGILEVAKHNVATAGAANIHLQVGDAEHLNFPDDNFDGVLC